MKYQKKIALCAIICAMNVLVLLFGAVLDVLDLTAAAVSMMLVAVVAIEIGGYYSWLSWGVTGVLAFFILPNKFPALLFLLLGYYPILREYFAHLPAVLSWVLKLLWFNAALTVMIWGVNSVLMLPDTGLVYSPVVYLVGNGVFVFLEVCFAILIRFYRMVLRRRLGLDRLFR